MRYHILLYQSINFLYSINICTKSKQLNLDPHSTDDRNLAFLPDPRDRVQTKKFTSWHVMHGLTRD
jgi:hypothetical protein